jgi:hypothetical protein
VEILSKVWNGFKDGFGWVIGEYCSGMRFGMVTGLEKWVNRDAKIFEFIFIKCFGFLFIILLQSRTNITTEA